MTFRIYSAYGRSRLAVSLLRPASHRPLSRAKNSALLATRVTFLCGDYQQLGNLAILLASEREDQIHDISLTLLHSVSSIPQLLVTTRCEFHTHTSSTNG